MEVLLECNVLGGRSTDLLQSAGVDMNWNTNSAVVMTPLKDRSLYDVWERLNRMSQMNKYLLL